MKAQEKKVRQAPTVLAIQHVACETPGTIGDALKRKNISVKLVRAFEGEEIPSGLGEVAGLIVMGGPMGVYEQDRHPFLRREIELIERALKAEKPVLGVCLGSQLLAAVLGARVTPGKQKEIGWYPIRLGDNANSDPLWKGIARSFTAFHWHGDRFELPAGAIPLASSELTECQAFRCGRNSYGLLFHMEVTEKLVRDMVRTFANELREAGQDGAEIVRAAGRYLPSLRRIAATVFGRWARLVQTPADWAGVITLQRVYQATEAAHGERFLVDGLWPRGLTKQALHGVRWLKDVAPSDALRRWYGHDVKKWQEFRARYFTELEGKREAWRPIVDQARRAGVVLLYSARDTEHNNATALRDYLIAKLKRR